MTGVKNALMGIYMILTVMMPVSIKGRPTRRFSSGMTTLALAAVVLLVATGGASALDPCPAPGNTDISASCELTQDYTVTTVGQYGYKIIADNVVIDGKDYKITGTMPATCGGGEATPCTCAGVVNDDYDNAVVKDLEITGFCTGVSMGRSGQTYPTTNMSVIGCTIHDCGKPGMGETSHGIHLVGVDHSTISKNEIYNIDGEGTDGGCGGGGNGIFVYGDGVAYGNYNTITHNDIFNNNKSGIFTKMQSQHNNISYNNVTGPGHWEGGITLMCMMSSYNLVEGNNVSGNEGSGIYIGGRNNTLVNNTINDNGDYGIGIDRSYDGSDQGSAYTDILNNTILRNGFDAPVSDWKYGSGVWITPWYNNHLYTELYNNTICDNRDKDIYNGDPSTKGDWNMCYTATDYNDTNNASGHYCVWQCTGAGPDLVIRDLDPHWVNSYNVSFEVYNQGVENAAASDTSVKIVNRNDVVVHEATYSIPALAIGIGHQMEIGPFNINNDEPHTITVCADIDDDVDEYGFGNEDNNCSTDVFGAPDLIITGFPTEDWVDASKKLVNLTYTVRNVGDANITAGQSFSVCVLAVTGGSWGPCCEVVQGPLNVSESYTGTIGPITVDTGNEKVQVYADYYNVIIENDERCEEAACATDNCDHRHVVYPGPCLGCGDVDCAGGVNPTDLTALVNKLDAGVALDCEWAGNVDCIGGVNPTDLTALVNKLDAGVALPGCCGGGC